ncbi:RNA 2'-phosphotransferase [Actinomadura rubteroloni]|uniref:Probable RNA 2'-phosphotransferase n=1 Tax=Actinomadura rubteroloni TaxID=1926885 RepID=A0A2P4UH00_9ACTN|nr:RNA 2'-phosphotransferase [Actinomadura rubteroloni]POM24343.1 RNA 2'-phosphotransferase [Actinomadura rubteroloni]
MDDRTVAISRFLGRHLRHRPEAIGLVLDASGWTDVAALLAAAARHGFPVTRAELDAVVASDAKGRYALDAAGLRIRANQGHSVPVELGLPVAAPPPVLFHGTVRRALDGIRRDGLLPMGRHAVHLSPDRATAERVGTRRGRPVVLTVDAAGMAADGHEFRVSANGVWLVAAVPPRFLALPQ